MLARSLRFRGFSGFLMVLMVWNVIPVRQSIRGLRQRSPTELTSAWVHDGVCACLVMRMDRELSKQIMSYESTTAGHLQEETNPITPCWIFSIGFILIAAMHELHNKNARYFFIQPSAHASPPLSPHPHVNTPMPVSNCLLSLRHSYLQAPGCHCRDDLLNAKWYGV